MAPLRTTPYQDPNLFLGTATRVASSYGFSSLDDVIKERGARRPWKTQCSLADYKRGIDSHSAELLTAMRSCVEHDIAGEEKPPALVYFSNLSRTAKQPKTTYFGLGFIGSRKSIAEALIIKTSLAILDEIGAKDARVHINSMGDRDSLARLTRELTTYFRKHINSLPPQAQQALKRDVLHALDYVHQKKHDLRHTSPRTMEFLTDDSRRHFREVIEYLDALDVRYELDDSIIGTRDCHSQTLLEIRTGTDADEEVVAWGGRFDEMPRHVFRTELPAVGIVFSCKSPRAKMYSMPSHKPRRPQVFFIQLGFEAKLRSLPLLDTLRRSRIVVDQHLDSDRLSEQLSRAEVLNVPYAVIVGHKEALEGTAIVRNMDNRSQEIISLAMLPSYLQTHLR